MPMFPKVTVHLNDIPDVVRELGQTDYFFKYIPINWLPASVGQKMLGVQDIAQKVTADEAAGKASSAEDVTALMAAQLSVVSMMIVEWNFDDNDGQPLPLPKEDGGAGWEDLPIQLRNAIWVEMLGNGDGAEIPLANDSSSSPESPQAEVATPPVLA